MVNKKQTIFFDGLGLVEGHFSGVGQYILGILRGLDNIIDDCKNTQKPFHRVKVIVPYDSIGKFKSFKFKHIEYVIAPLSFRQLGILWSRNKLPPIDIFFGKGVYIFPRFVSMPLLFSKSAIVIYDISFELHRQFSDERNAQFLSGAVKRSVKTTDKIITISNNAKKEIVNFYDVNKNDVVVATPATDPSFLYRRSTAEIEKVKRKYKIEGDYILTLSNLEPRKNLGTLVEAYCELPKKLRDKNSLLLVGVTGWKTDQLFSRIVEKVKKGYKIIRPSTYVCDEDKAAIISGAKILVYPSHYEGFGMPPLEALACGTPVITADNSSLPEVVGEAGIMLKSSDINGFTKSIESILNNPDSVKDIITKGPERARLFSWEKSAQVYIDVAEELS